MLFVRSVLIGILGWTMLGSNVSAETLVRHSFEFGTIRDSPNAVVLDYQYGSSKQFGMRANPEMVQLGRTFGQWRIHGGMPRGEFLFVKWRLLPSGEEYEDHVELRQRLPADITDHRIHFVVRGSQLYLYVISPEHVRRPAGSPPGPIKMYGDLQQIQESIPALCNNSAGAE